MKMRFTFSSVTVADVAKEINILNSSKAKQEADLPVKLLKNNKDFFPAYIAKIFQRLFEKCKAPKLLEVGIYYSIFQEKCTHI